MKRIRWGLLFAIGAMALVLGGCGFFSGLFPSNQGTVPSSDEVWVDQGVWADAALSPRSLGQEGPGGPKYVPGQLIVGLKSGRFTDAAINALQSKHGVQLRGRINQLRLILVSLPAGADLAAAKAKLQAEADVESVGLNYVYELFGGQTGQALTPKHITNDTYMPIFQWGLFAIDFHRIAASVLPTTAPIVAVVDTGVDYNHPDLGAAKVIRGPDYFDGDMDPMDTTGHGTHVAGIAAALTDNNAGVAGVSGRSRVLAIRVGDSWIPVFAGAAGIVYAADYAGVRVINLSWGGPMPDRYIADAVAYASGKGVLVVAAAGNSDTTLLMYPAAYPNVLAVGATALWEAGWCPIETQVMKACFSNYGGYVDIAAPGVSIYSTTPTGGSWLYDPMYDWSYGTSMAAPYVAGAAALVWGKWPNLSRAQVADLLTTTGDSCIRPDDCERHAFPGHVRHLNVYNAFAARMTMPAAGGALIGLVVDAHTGLPLQGATVTARSGTITRTATTRSDGMFTITDMPAATYTVTASKSGYVTTTDETTWEVLEGCWNYLPFFALPANQATDVWTAVVEWRGWCEMSELDSYLCLPSTLPDRNKYLVSYFDRGNMNVHPFARFLRDEPGQAPGRVWWPLYAEALTFRTRYTGNYVFAVHDFSGFGDWACADAVVRLYRGTTLVGTYLARNATGSGMWWTPFRISGTTVTSVQTLGYGFPFPYGWEPFSIAAQRKPPVADPGIPSGQFRFRPR